MSRGIHRFDKEETLMLEVGKIAPRFSLLDEREREVELPTTGAPAVLVFYRGDW